VVAIGAIAILGVMLLLGVLIGKKDNNTTQTVAAQAPATTTTAAAPTATTAATAGNKKAAKAAAAAGTAPGQGAVIQGGSGKVDPGVAAANNASTLQNAKNGPDVVATQGPPPATDNKPAGGGSGSGTCIGC
jgi:predicted lipid-binding transport protein (Tim44 family)